MNLYLFDDESVVLFSLPNTRIGDFWMTDNSNKNIVNIRAKDNEWILSASEQTKIISSQDSKEIILKAKAYYIVEKNNKKYVLFCDYDTDNSFVSFAVSDQNTVRVGKSVDNEISLSHPYLLDTEFVMAIENGFWKIKKNLSSNLYLNNKVVKDEVFYAKNGDVINIYGFRIVLVKNMIFVNTPYGTLNSKLPKKELIVKDELTEEEIQNLPMYNDGDYFLRSPRMRRDIKTFELGIDSPPQKENMQETPLIMTLAPMLTMGASSMVTLMTTLQAVSAGERTWKQSIPSIVITVAMLFTMLVWPFVTRAYEKKQKIKRESERQEKYSKYLHQKEEEIAKVYDEQKKILDENLLPTNVCYDAIINKRRTLWGRRIDQKDFLTVRVGKGQVPFNAHISYQSSDFTMEDDNLKQAVDDIVNKYSVLNDVPIGYSFTENVFTAVTGLYPKYNDFTNNLLLQMMSFHSYDNLKFVIFTNEKNAKYWNYLKDSPYCFSNDKSIRFFATNTEEMQEVSEYLKPRFLNRQEIGSSDNDFSKYSSYYLILVDDIDSARKIGIIDTILEEKRNLGFSLVVLEEKLSKIPSEITRFLTIGDSAAVIINSDNNEQTRFTDEIVNNYNMDIVTDTVANLPVYIENSVKGLPETISFLEMYGVGQIDQLNVVNRWKDNNPIKSLKAEIGVNENGDPFILDLHEKAHGPHGLIAGMTGSGKSEFIISYVLSMAVNYSPEEVAFVLIDYKGGGLANAFINNETGKKLPHVVGTITNLDKVEINRALSSIQSELRRRQEKFNEVREKSGESTIDIYKYQKLYRDGVIREPMPHLIIVCDEFAELKEQQPDFMDDLISTARIGRSLGVHLVLATQKPSGVVDAQIWSNSKFKVCLKVQDKSDSSEMIRSDLAAELKNVGRFYLQVGYNEFFAQGQAAWAGAQYYPSKEYKKQVDKNLYFISNTGAINQSINNSTLKKLKSEGDELSNIVKYIINVCEKNEYQTRQLWLDRIPNNILISNLYKKYNFAKERFIINPIIGEYDDPTNQTQGLLTLPLTSGGNAIIYGTPDSGKDELLSSFVYSSIMTYDTSELNMYIMDFGAETLMNYQNAAQVGNVILTGDDEKMENLAKMLNTELSKRKKAFMQFNGNYQDFIKMSGKTLPNIVVVINAVEVLNEINPDYVDNIVPIIRDGNKYGISFVITAPSPNSARFKVVQCCKQALCLQMGDEADYRDILGKTNGLLPSVTLGRGLAKLDRVVEFQTAFITGDDNPIKAINELISLLSEKGINKAREIPVMPDTIEISRFKNEYTGITSVPIGLTKETLLPYLYDFSKNAINVVCSSEMDNMKLFVPNFIKTIESNDSFNKVVIDANNYFDNFNYNINYISGDFNSLIDQIKNIDKNLQDFLEKNNMNLRSIKDVKNNLVVIFGIDKLIGKLDDEHKDALFDVIQNQKEVLKINFLLIDTPLAFKPYEYEDWYKAGFDSSNGIWVGMGAGNQYTINLSSTPSYINTITNDYAVVSKNGIPVVVKLINEIKN